jgi:N-acylmannosamine kinase
MTRPDAPHPETLALDIGGTKTAAARVAGGRILARAEVPTPPVADRTPLGVVAAALGILEPLRARAAGLGVAMTGRVVGGRTYPLNQETLPGWEGFDLRGRLETHTGLPTVVLNDARAAAWGEAVYGAGRGVSEFAFVTVSTGVGAGLVLGGELYRAANGLEGELGFTHVGAPGEGVLEHAASGTALGRAAAARGWGDARDLAERAEAGDEEADALYKRSAHLLAAKLADLAVMLGVTRVALGGSVGLRAGYLARVRAALAPLPHPPEVVHAELGPDAGLLGAADYAGKAAMSSER